MSERDDVGLVVTAYLAGQSVPIPEEERNAAVRRALLVFERNLASEGRLGFWRWLSLFLGAAGTYRQNDSVDVIYEVNGRRTVATALPMRTD